MTPEQISVIQTIAFILERIGSWPIGTLFGAIVVGPWVVAFILHIGQNKRFEAVRQMYENNVKLVEGYEKMADNQQDLIIMCTKAMQALVDSIKSNLFCPIVRQGTEKREPGP